MPIFVVSRLFALLIEKRTRHAVVGVLIDCASKESSGGGGGGRSLVRAFATPIKKITIDLEDEDMQWAVIYNAFASNERAFAQSRQSIFYSH